ncbi:hypothetical protein PW035_13490 [Nonomuraea angiospora]|nr:hypothetical protein [Nonomuraea angiospora]MDX3101847.1 hypothetical protein [Nonomuraea angiospora]
MSSLLEELERRENAARERVEQLREQIAELTRRLEAEEDRVSRLVITRETRAERKWLCGSIITDPGAVIAKVFDHAAARNPAHARPWVVLVDGARHQLDLINAEAARHHISVHIVIDFVHVLEKLWAAAWSLHPPDAATASTPASAT